MTDDNVANEPGLPAAWRHRTWTSPAMAAAGRLYAGLRRRARLPAKTGIRLSVPSGPVAEGTASAYAPVGLAWWSPAASWRLFSPIEVYLSRRYFLPSGQPGRPVGGAASHVRGETTALAAKGIGESVPQGLRLATGSPLRLAGGARRDLESGSAAGSSGSDIRAGAPPANVVAALALSSLRLLPIRHERPVASMTSGDVRDGHGETRARPSVITPARRAQNAATADAASLGDLLYDRAMHQLSTPAPALHMTTADAGGHERGRQRADSLPGGAPMPVPEKSGPTDTSALSREEVVHIADRVAQVLKQRERFERERQGRL